MNYDEFLIYKNELIKKNPQLIDYSNNNLYDFFSYIQKNEGFIPSNLYRCHMVEDYLKMMNLPDSYKEFVGASNGVRHSLDLLFKELNNWIIPSDVYPFYTNSLNVLNKEYKTYKTHGEKNLFTDIKNDGVLLVCFPLKPDGRSYSVNEFSAIKNFLKRNPTNLLVIDLVYWCNFNIPKELLELYLNGQTIILHSLSKMFLSPNIFGVALLPQNFLGNKLRLKFQLLSKNEIKLKEAYKIMQYNLFIPMMVKQWLIKKSNNLGIIYDEKSPSYLYFSNKEPSEYLNEGIIVIPATVFGGTNGSIISILFN